MAATDIVTRFMFLPVRDIAADDPDDPDNILVAELIYGPGLEPRHVTLLLDGWTLLVPHADLAAGRTRTVRSDLGGGLQLAMFPQAGGESVVWELSQATADGGRVTVLLVKVDVGWLLPNLSAAADVAPAGVSLPVVDWDTEAARFLGGQP
ncbi:hypothetical protein [Nonomuraea sp. SYSU D8015]|uniref:hypothetical protein n=1 Tax=Nonomuraea sp. SYSU D8015 TaxID=2593644 RepID=UPI00166051D1|nr:hypothetical protein [Nonomuraea sp. SYSU D8015]